MAIHRDDLDEFFTTTTLGSPDAAVGFVLWRLVHRFQREMNRELTPLDLTHLQFTVLALVAWSNRNGTATQAKLARDYDVEPMQMSQMMKVLEAKGLILRRAPDINQRLKCAEITAKGLNVLGKAMPIAVDIQRRMFGAEGQPGGKLHKMLLRSVRQPTAT
jgi:DNA-binding MarR family transcriptional regulator